MENHSGRRGGTSTRNFFGASSSVVATSPFVSRRGQKIKQRLNGDDVAPKEERIAGMQILTRPAALREDTEKEKNFPALTEAASIGFAKNHNPSFLSNHRSRDRDKPQLKLKPATRLEKEPPTSGAAVEATPADVFQLPPPMKEAVKLISDFDDISEGLTEFLSSSVNYTVISAIGNQGVGKSTLLSMIAGNNSQDMYRDYAFRPVSRDANEFSRHQTQKVEIFVTRSHQILIDCQALNSYSVLNEGPWSGSSDVRANLDMLKLLAFVFHVSHTVLVCSEWFIDLNLIKTIRTAEFMRANLGNHKPEIALQRKVNLVFVHTKANSADFTLSILSERIRVLRGMFEDSKWFRLPKSDKMLLIPLSEIKPRKDYYAESATKESLLEEECVEDFDDRLRDLRIELCQLPRDGFAKDPLAIDEKKWLLFCRAVWLDGHLSKALQRFRVVWESATAIV